MIKKPYGGKNMSMIKCPECQKEISETANSCPNCGYTFTKMKFCKFCGEKIPYDSVICTKCGRQVENQKNDGGITINNASSSSSSSSSSASATSENAEEKRKLKRIDKNIALLLCIFLGWCGGHKFYEGKSGMGVLYILTFGLCGIGWIIDIIAIATKPNPYYV